MGGILSSSGLSEEVMGSLSSSGTLLDTASLDALRQGVDAAAQGSFDSTVSALRDLLSSSVSLIFWMCAILLVVSFLLMAFVKNVKKEEG